MGYKPETYFTSVEKDDIPLWKHIKGYVTVVSVGTTTDASVPIQVGNSKCNALIDTGATKSVISESYCKDLMLPTPKQVYNIDVRSASGNRLKTMGITECAFSLGNQPYTYNFLVCKDLSRPIILGLDFLRANRIGTDWSDTGKFVLQQKNLVLVESLETYIIGPRIYTKNHIEIPGRTLAVLNVTVEVRKEHWNKDFYVKANRLLINEYPNLIAIPTLHIVRNAQNPVIPYVLVNLSTDQIYLPKRKLLGQLIPTENDNTNVFPETVYADICNINDISELNQENIEIEKKFITSPADVEVHRKVELQDAEVSDKHKQQFADLCKEYDDIFSKDSADIGRTPIIMMDIDTGDSPPISQRPYNLPLKHADWVQKELDTLEKAGVITRSVSPWASPIVIVPKKTEPGEPPRRRLCVDYRAINKLLPTVKKVGSNAKGVLTLVPLPKIDEIYAKLKGSSVYSTFDMRSGYYHMGLSADSQAKSAFVIGGPHTAKFEFKVCPFGLAQAPAYFQRMVNEVLRGLPFAFGYLDDILIFSPDMDTHLDHVRQLFDRLREADLKLKESKCNFLKAHVQYLGHLISGKGIEPVPEKLESIKNMPSPTTPKEVKQFLGLIGYYRKFIPKFSDVARPLTNLTKKDVPFEWTPDCQQTFQLLKDLLIAEPILKYPDPNKPYVLYTDASKYAWSCVLTQEYEYEDEGKLKKIHHPITYASGLFKGSQINWATLTKEAYAIYRSVRKLTYYLEDADVLLRSDHLPLKKFLEKNTLNSKVNNWAVEISPFRIEFEYIKGIKNTLADTMSRLIKITPDVEPEEEPEGFEFGYYAFEELEPIHTTAKLDYIMDIHHNQTDVAIPNDIKVEWGLTPVQIKQVQQKDKFCKEQYDKIVKGSLPPTHPYYIKDGILMKYVTDNKQKFETIVVPDHYTLALLRLAHDELGHNGSSRTYMMLRRLYFWKGMKPQVFKYVKQCKSCLQRNSQIVRYTTGHFNVPTSPMQFISMDLIGEFHPPSAKGHKYALTVICMLTGYTFCIPLKTKTAAEVVKAYVDNIYSKFGGSIKMLSDNGTEFKNELFTQVAQELGVEYKIYTPPYHPQSNGRIEGFHNFLKACLSKHVSSKLEWDDVVPLACAAYNFMPNEHSKESPFFLMFGREALLPLNTLFKPSVRYLGNDENLLSLEALKNIYQLVAENLKKARQRSSHLTHPQPHKIQPEDSVLIKDHTAGPFQSTYKGDFRVVSLKGNQVEVMPATGGKTHFVHVQDVKYVLPTDSIIAKLPNYDNFGRKTKLRLNPDNIPDLHWELATLANTITSTTSSYSTPKSDLISIKTITAVPIVVC